MSLLLLRRGERPYAPSSLLVAGLCGKIGCVYLVILLRRDRVVLQQLGIAFLLATGVVQLHPCLLYARVSHTNALVGSLHARGSHLLASQGIGQVGLSLGQAQAKLAILDDDQRVAFVHLLKLLETYLLDETRDTRVDRRDLSLHGGIVRKFPVTKMDEVVDDQIDACSKQQQDDEIVETAKYRYFFHHVFLNIHVMLTSRSRPALFL